MAISIGWGRWIRRFVGSVSTVRPWHATQTSLGLKCQAAELIVVVVRPCGGLVVDGAGLEAPVQNADEPIG